MIDGWQRRREKLQGRSAGELEYAFLFEAAQAVRDALLPSIVEVSTLVPGDVPSEVVAPPPAPAFQRPAAGCYGTAPPRGHVELPPGSLMVGDLMLPPLMTGLSESFSIGRNGTGGFAPGPRAPLRSLPPPITNQEPR